MNVFFQWEFITKPTNYAILVLFNACFTEIVVWHKTNWDIDSNTEKNIVCDEENVWYLLQYKLILTVIDQSRLELQYNRYFNKICFDVFHSCHSCLVKAFFIEKS